MYYRRQNDDNLNLKLNKINFIRLNSKNEFQYFRRNITHIHTYLSEYRKDPYQLMKLRWGTKKAVYWRM